MRARTAIAELPVKDGEFGARSHAIVLPHFLLRHRIARIVRFALQFGKRRIVNLEAPTLGSLKHDARTMRKEKLQLTAIEPAVCVP